MLNILFIGDIVGKIGRKAVAKILPSLKRELKADLVIANAENLAHGKGTTETTIKEMMATGIDWFTNGDHAFDTNHELYQSDLPILRPANYSTDVPGNGFATIKAKTYQILLINLIGRVFMSQDYDDPFRKTTEILTNLAKKKLSAIIVDIHAEATSEKVALGHYLDGKVSAVIGTHTHVMTADEKISDQGTAYITDLGMVGLADGVIGVERQGIIQSFLTQIKSPHIIPENGKAIFNAVLLTIDPKTKKAAFIKPIIKFINII